MSRRISLFVVVLAVVVRSLALAQPAVNTNGTPFAIGGYDVVAYFADKRPVRGVQEYAASYLGATWLFASAEHKARFERSPEAFAPAYLGYCAYGAAQNRLVKIDPRAWTVLDEKLYLNYSLEIRATWLQAPAKYIAEANQNWPGLSR